MGKVIHWAFYKRLKTDDTENWFNAQARIYHGKWDLLNSRRYEKANKSPNPAQKSRTDIS